MKCPLLHPDGETTESAIIAIPQDCLKEECAWWNFTEEQCCIKIAGEQLGNINDSLGRITKELTLLRPK